MIVPLPADARRLASRRNIERYRRQHDRRRCIVGFSLGTDDVVDLSGFGQDQTVIEQQALIGLPGSILHR